MYFPDRGVYAPYAPCMYTPLLVLYSIEESTYQWINQSINQNI